MKKILFRTTLAFIVLFFAANQSYCGICHQQNFLMNSVSGSVVVGTQSATATVELDPLAGNSFSDYNIKDVITLSVPLENYPFTQPFFLEAKIDVTPYNSSNVAQPQFGIILQIKYNPYSGVLDFNDKESNVLQGQFPKYTITLTELTQSINGGNPTIITTLPDFVRIDAEITCDRVYDFISVANNSFAFSNLPEEINSDCDLNGIVDEIKVSWPEQAFAEGYDLEWTFTNNYGTTLLPPLSDNLVVYDFRNSIRVTTTDHEYKIPLTYDRGYLVFRIRAVGRNMNLPSQIIYGKWNPSTISGMVGSLPISLNNHYQILNSHEPSLNWQTSTSFAEGRKKDVISYFDGALKNRETVTRSNTDSNAIVGQTIYDNYARPVINVLPVPVVSSDNCLDPVSEQKNPVRFYPKFNRNATGNQYSASDFDLDNGGCPPLSPLAVPMDSTSGASLYYSSNNQRTTSFRDYVPKAYGYPFSQTEFIPDNRGLVSKQGSVGPQYQLNGHATRYLYGAPNQVQLDRLFGPEAGDASHYKKNVVIDQNGQASVSYLDMQGKTVITSLSGNRPANLEWSNDADQAFVPMSVDLFNKYSNGVSAINHPAGDSIMFSSEITVVDQGDFTFKYDLSIGAFRDVCMVSNVCFDCVYDLTISITDECGVERASGIFGSGAPQRAIVGADVSYNPGNHQYTINYNTSCVDPYVYPALNNPLSLTVNLPPGKYTVCKSLKINEEARKKYLAMYLSPVNNLCYKTLDYFKDQEKLTYDTSDCHVRCEKCVESIGDRDEFVSKGGTPEEFDMLVKECMAPCTQPDECGIIFGQMIADVLPGGQYGQYLDGNTGLLNLSLYPLSVLNENNSLPKSLANWKHPQRVDPGTGVLLSPADRYLDRDGLESKIIVTEISPNVFSPQPDDVSHIHPDPLTGQRWIYPQHLNDVADFIRYYNQNSSWANSLVFYHPEFCNYAVCRGYDAVLQGKKYSSKEFDDLLKSTETYSEAVTRNLMSNGAPTFGDDPFLDNSRYAPYALALSYRLNVSYQKIQGLDLNIAQFSTLTVLCGNQFGMTVNSTATPCFDFINASQDDKDQIWKMIRNLYLGEKRKIKEERYKRDLKCVYNDCIGNVNFDPWKAGMLKFSFLNWSSNKFFSAAEPCNQATYNLYRTKIKRFIGSDDALALGNQSDVEAQLYRQTGQCPVAFHLQNFLSGLSSRKLLDNQNVSLKQVDEFSQKLYEVLNGNLDPPYNEYKWNANSANNILDVEIRNPNGDVICNVQLDKFTFPSQVSWDDITSIESLKPNGISGNEFRFVAVANVIDNSSGSPVVSKYTITGFTTCFKIDGCTFPEKCKLNDLGMDLRNLLTALTLNDKLFTNQNVLLKPGTIYDNFITTQIANALGAVNPSAGQFSYAVDMTSSPVKIVLEITYSLNNKSILLEINNLKPSNFSSFSSIKSLEDFIAANQNGFELDAKDIFGNKILHAKGISILFDGGRNMLPMGECQVPGPLECETKEHHLKKDLEALLTSVNFESYNSVWTSIDLSKNMNFTYLLDTYLPDASPLNNHLIVQPGEPEDLVFDFGNCDIILTSDTSPSGIPVHHFSNLLYILPPLALAGAPDDYGFRYKFIAQAVFSTGGNQTELGYITGISCIPLQSCDTCPWDTIPADTSMHRQANGFDIHSFDKDGRLLDQEYGNISTAMHSYLFSAQGGGSSDSCRFKYNEYIAAIHIFNNSTYSHSTGIHLSESLFTGFRNFSESGYCSCVQLYIEYLNQYNNGLLSPASPPPSDIRTWSYACNPVAEVQCDTIYQLYLYKLKEYNNCSWAHNRHHDLSLTLFLGVSDFYYRGYCFCASAYFDYLRDYVHNSHPLTDPPPLPITEWPGCKHVDENACAEYFDYLNAVNQYNMSAFAAALSHSIPLNLFSGPADYFNKGFCKCTAAYIIYLNSFAGNISDPFTGVPELISNWNGCLSNGDPCVEAYNRYNDVVTGYQTFRSIIHGYPDIPGPVYSYEEFVSLGLCNCVDGYVAYINAIINGFILIGNINLNHLLLAGYCDDVQPHINCNDFFPPLKSILDTFPKADPCEYQMISNAELNAKLLFDQLVQKLTTDFTEEYNRHCLGAVENFTMNYSDREYHFTLYYYDQSGNLVRTIPPEGVEPLDIKNYNDPLEVLVKLDRTNNTQSVFTTHRLASKYEYNSLNQLVRQSLPDHDKMDICEYALPTGVDPRVKVTSIYFLDERQGYLTGYIENGSSKRGYLYYSYDAGQTWTHQTDLLAADINKIQMVTALVGYAVCNSGFIIKTIDGGSTWDILNSFDQNKTSALNDLYFTSTSTGIIVGDNSILLRTTDGGQTFTQLSVPALSATIHLKSISYTNNIFYASGINASNQNCGIILRSNGGLTWTALTGITTTELKKVRFMNQTTAHAVGYDGNLLTTTDGGTKWFETNTGISQTFRDFYFKNANEAVAILENSASGELWKGSFQTSGTTWTSMNTLANYNSLYPYENTSTATKLIAVGNAGRVDKVIMNSAPYGMFNISPTGSGNPDFYSACAFNYTVSGSTRLFVAAAGKSNILYYTMNGNSSIVSWQTYTMNSVALTSGEFIKSIVIQPFTNTLSGTVLTSKGKLYSIFAQGFPVALSFTNSAFTIPGQNFSDLQFLPAAPGSSPTNSDVFAMNITSPTNKNFHRIALSNSAPTVTTSLITNLQPAVFYLLNPVTFSVIASGTQRKFLLAGEKLPGPGGWIVSGSHTAGTGTLSSTNSSTILGLPFRDIAAKSANEAVAVGDNGTMVLCNGTGMLRLRSGQNRKITSIDNYKNQFYVFGREDGLLYKTVSFSGNIVSSQNLPLTLAAGNINDIRSDAIGNAVIACDGGMELTSTDLTIAQPQIKVGQTIDPNLNFKGASFIPASGTADVFIGTSGGKIYKYGSGYTQKIRYIFPPKLNDVHFFDSNNGIVAGEKGFYRNTATGNTGWNVVLPVILQQNSTYVVLSANTVYSISSDSSFAAGARNFLGLIANGTFSKFLQTTSTDVTFNDIEFNGSYGIVAGTRNTTPKRIAYYKTQDHGSKWNGTALGLNAGPGVSTVLNGTSNNTANAIHIFNNKRFVVVGDFSTVVYGDLKASGNSIGITTASFTPAGNFPSSISNASLKDVTFVDDGTGYIVGGALSNTGISWKTQSLNNALANTNSAPTGVIWVDGCGLVDGLTAPCNITNGKDVDLTSICFPSRFDGILGGNVSSYSACNSSTAGYIRLLHDESGKYSGRFWYDKLGRLILSQNTKQYNYTGKGYSYTIYDELGRIKEAGEKRENTDVKFRTIFGSILNNVYNPLLIDDAKLAAWINSPNGARLDVTHTYYDTKNIIVPSNIFPQSEETMRKRVASVTFESLFDNNDLSYDHATHYDYDIHGNVKSLLQDNPQITVTSQRYKRTDYDYDLISGNVNSVTYQKDQPDQFIHEYRYDGDNRIIKVMTSRDNVNKETDGKYFYYEHGPLARTELGEHQVQGVDYAYTLQGWLKGINSNVLTPDADMGKDGKCQPSNPNSDFANDAFGYTLGYNDNDYTSIGTLPVNFEANMTASDFKSTRRELFNGNISSTVATITPTGSWTYNGANNPLPAPLGTVYRYDQLNRIRESNSYDNLLASTNSWQANGASINKYRTGYTYDRNGNIKTLSRYDAAGTSNFDQLQYGYYAPGGKLLRNRLYHVDDLSTQTNGSDITDDPSPFVTTTNGYNTNNNYGYDEIGNLNKDTKEEISQIDWNVAGKMKRITRPSGSTKHNLSFDYDAMGNRIAKHEYTSANAWLQSTYYVRDAQGNPMAVYLHKNESPQATYNLTERHICGSSRLGMDVDKVDMVMTTSLPSQVKHILGLKQYELNNHLGNVQEVVSDYKIPVDDGDFDSNNDATNDVCTTLSNVKDGVIDKYISDVVSGVDYYPFGMVMMGREYTSEKYRYGYNGQEKVNEIQHSEGVNYDYGSRQYNSRLGIFLSIDPMSSKFVSWSPFIYAANSPIRFADEDGVGPNDPQTRSLTRGIL